MKQETVTIQFEPSGIRTSVVRGVRVLDAARAAGVSIPAFCGGNSSCGKCKIRLISIEKPENVSEFSDTEQLFVSKSEQIEHIRLACETKVYGNIKVLCLQEEKENENVILTDASIPERSETFTGTKRRLGAAIDIGTTTLAAYLYDQETGKQLSSEAAMNPQIPYGDDVISRISFCNKGTENLVLLQNLIRNALSSLLISLCNKAEVCLTDIFETVLVGNTVMIHILLGFSPECLGHAPFTPAIRDSQKLRGQDLNLPVAPGSTVYILPSADGFIGADHMAALLAADPGQYEGSTLVIDIGTNSEICLYTDGRYYCTSCATGPALEGATIHCGMHAAVGAIDHVSIDPVTLKPEIHVIGYKNDGLVRGICGSGIIDAAASMLSNGILDADGCFSSHAVSEYIQTGENGEKEYILHTTENPGALTSSQSKIVITQQDIRNIQLAKAALYAGTKLLLEKSQIVRPDRILLAGAFGSYIDVRQALRLGLFPDCDPACITAIGNAAGAGAVLSLLDPSKREKAEKLAYSIYFIESANDPAFSKVYGDAMLLPHRRDCFNISNPVTWTCPGEDRHYLPEEVYALPLDILKNPQILAGILPKIREYNKESSLLLPIVQNLEACCYGAPLKKMKGYWAPGEYPYKTLEEAEQRNYSLLPDDKIQAVLETVRCLLPLVEIEAPFTILSALVDPGILYKAARKEPERLSTLLKKIADAECVYIEHLIRAGAKVLSLADPLGTSSLTGEKVYREVILPSQQYLLKKSRRYLKNGLIHLCGHMAADLIRTGAAVPHPVRLDPKKSYTDNLTALSMDSRIRYAGLGCIRNSCSGLSLGTVLDIL